MTGTLRYTGNLTVLTCWCGMRHAVPSELREYQERQHRDGEKQRDIYCPLGHSYILAGKGEAERLRDQLTEAQDALTRAEARARAEELSHSATKGTLTKVRKRAAAGVCPVCHRSFASTRMAAHVKTKHPNFAVVGEVDGALSDPREYPDA